MRATWVRICTRSLASRFDSGSSIRNAFGSRTIPRPMATRRARPPDRLARLRPRWPVGVGVAARRVGRLALEVLVEVEDLGRLAGLAVDLLLGRLLELERERHVLAPGH